MALMKPGFYMLTQHGPWSHHVRLKGTDEMNEAVMWLARQGKAENIDYEILIERIEHKKTKRVITPGIPTTRPSGRSATLPQVTTSVEPIMFFNEVKLAAYVKLTWGGI